MIYQSRKIHYFHSCMPSWMPCKLQYNRQLEYLIHFSVRWFSVGNCMWHHYMRPFSERLSFAYSWFCLDNTTFYLILLWCYYFDHSFDLPCCLAPLILLIAFLGGLVLFCTRCKTLWAICCWIKKFKNIEEMVFRT